MYPAVTDSTIPKMHIVLHSAEKKTPISTTSLFTYGWGISLFQLLAEPFRYQRQLYKCTVHHLLARNSSELEESFARCLVGQ